MQARSGCAQRVRGLGGSGRFLGVNSLVRAGHSGRFDAPSLLRATLWLQPKMALACAVAAKRMVSMPTESLGGPLGVPWLVGADHGLAAASGWPTSSQWWLRLAYKPFSILFLAGGYPLAALHAIGVFTP